MLTFIFAIFASILLLGAAAGYYFFFIALKRSSNKKAVLNALPKFKNDEETSFFEKITFEDRYQNSFDGLRLHAIYVKNESDRWVIIQHGYMSKAIFMDDIAEFFHKQGFNVLLPDARAHGDSQGTYIGMGWLDRMDVLMWINKISADRPNSQILLYGISMGAATMMMLSGEKLPTQVKGIIEDCGYSSIREECFYQLTEKFHVPSGIAGYVFFWSNIYACLLAKYNINDGDAKPCLSSSHLPVIFIHGSVDSFVPFYMLDQAYEASGSNDKQKYEFPKAEHGRAFASDPLRYQSILKDFIVRTIS